MNSFLISQVNTVAAVQSEPFFKSPRIFTNSEEEITIDKEWSEFYLCIEG